MKILSKKIYQILLILIMLTGTHAAYAKATITERSDFFPDDAYFYDAQGGKKFIEDYEGQHVLLVFWAMWCGTCADEMPKLDNLQKDFRKIPLKVVAISEDRVSMDELQDYFTKKELRHLEPFHDRNNQILTDMGIAGLPAAYLLDGEGRIKLELKGKIRWESDTLRAQIIEHMDGQYELPKNTFRHKQFFENISDSNGQGKQGNDKDKKTEK